MAWRKASVLKFLEKRKASVETIKDVGKRIDAIADKDGVFGAAALDKVMGHPELARDYEAAWETDPDLRFFSL